MPADGPSTSTAGVDRRLSTSFRQQSEAVARWVYVVVIAGAFGVATFVLAALEVIPLAPWFWLAVTLTVIILAQFFAYHQLRVARDEESARHEADRLAGERGLANSLDALIREGMELADELSVPPEQRSTGSGIPLFPEPELMQRVQDLLDRGRRDLAETRPSLLPVLTVAANETMKRERERVQVAEPDDSASNADKLAYVVEAAHAQPRIVLEGVLTGLAEARERLAAP